MSFQPHDLAQLDRLLSRAEAVVEMAAIAQGPHVPDTAIGMRHDCDNVILPAVQLAEWEHERGYRSTYFILHTAPYWQEKRLLMECLDRIVDLGHEIGFHVNAISAAIQTGKDPLTILFDALDELRGFGHPIQGVVAHGDPLCHKYGFVNDEIFIESPRPSYGEPKRIITGNVRLRPISRKELGLSYDPNWLPRAEYLSDSGGKWSQSLEQVTDRYAALPGQLHILQHPDWWSEALVKAEVAA